MLHGAEIGDFSIVLTGWLGKVALRLEGGKKVVGWTNGRVAPISSTSCWNRDQQRFLAINLLE